MKIYITLSLGILVVLSLSHCATEQKTTTAKATWLDNMHKLSAGQLRLLPIAQNQKEFSDPSRSSEVRSGLQLMVEASTAIVNDNDAPNVDPIIQFNAKQLSAEVRRAYLAFESKDYPTSRFAISRFSNYCISCHTRADRGTKDYPLQWETDISGLSNTRRLEFELANRRYRSALESAMKLAEDRKSASDDPYAWSSVIKKTMAMIVRVNDDPGQAQSLARAVVRNQGAPTYLRRDASAWLNDITTWKYEIKHPKSPTRGTFAAHESAALITNLRASRKSHELLEKTKSKPYAEALLQAGEVAQTLRELEMGNLDQFYYRRCIEAAPHTEISERCFMRLEESALMMNPFLMIDPNSEWEANADLADLRKLSQANPVSDEMNWSKHRKTDYDLLEGK